VVLRGAWTQLHQTWRGHRAIMGQARILFRSSDILLYFRTRAAHIWVIRERCWKWRQILHVLILVKSRTAVGEISAPIVEALPATEPPEYIFITIWLLINMQVQIRHMYSTSDSELEQQGWTTSTNNCPYIHRHSNRST